MMNNPLFLISILISALIAFGVIVVFVEICFVIFKIKQTRLRSVLRILPFVGLMGDLILNSVSLGHWLNPLYCGSCIQKILLTYFYPDLKTYLYINEISLLKYFGAKLSHAVFSLIFIVFLIMTFASVLRFLAELLLSARSLRTLARTETLCNRPIENLLLLSTLAKYRVKIFVTKKITIPMATYNKSIFISKEIVENIPQNEFEAIIAHELEHIKWKDPIIRLLSHFISAIFWWVPTQAWQKKLEFDQEVACDQSISTYGCQKEYLASALVNVATLSQEKIHKTLCYLNDGSSPLLKRLYMMIDSSKYSKGYKYLSYIIAIVGAIFTVLCALTD